jgi:hypothetical protein
MTEKTRADKKIPTPSLLVALAALSVSLQFTPGDSGGDTSAGANQATNAHEGKIRLAKAQKADGSLDAGIHFKYDLKAQKEARTKPKSGSPLQNNQPKLNLQKK